MFEPISLTFVVVGVLGFGLAKIVKMPGHGYVVLGCCVALFAMTAVQ